jgi:uncharacterized protein DUF6328
LLVISVGLLLWPAAYHRIVESGEATEQLHAFITRVMDWALLPFALGLGIEMYLAGAKVVGRAAAIGVSAVSIAVALACWYGIALVARTRRGGGRRTAPTRPATDDGAAASLQHKIDEVLTESRVVLPGAQALLGFQFATMLLEAFDRLPASSKYVHLASLAAIALTTVLLITPAAYHRIVERGEATESFLNFASAMVVAAMVPLALGIAGDLFVVVRKVTGSVPLALASAAVAVALLHGAWFGYTMYRRRRGPSTRAGHHPASVDAARRHAA